MNTPYLKEASVARPRSIQTPSRTLPRTLSRALWVLAALAAVLIVYLAAPYLPGMGLSRPLEQALPLPSLFVALHAVPAGLALLLGLFGLVPAARTRFPAAQRVLSRAYLACLLTGVAAGVVAAAVSTSGLAAQTGLLLLAAAWFWSDLMANRAARREQPALYRIWRVRSYAFAAASPLLLILMLLGLRYMTVNQAVTFSDLYTTGVWSSVLVPYLIAEWTVVPRSLGPLTQSAPTGNARRADNPRTAPQEEA